MPIKDINDPEHTLVLSATPEVQVYITENHEIAISVIGLHDNMESVENNSVYIPFEYAERVGKHLLALAKAAK